MRCRQQIPRTQQHHQRQRNQFGNRGDHLHMTGQRHAAHVYINQRPDQCQSGTRRHRRLAQEHQGAAQRADRRHGNRGIARPHRNPIAPGHGKAGPGTKRRPDIGIRSARLGNFCGQTRKHPGQRQCAHDRGRPPEQRVQAKRRQCGRQQVNARTDHVAHHQGKHHAKSKRPFAGVPRSSHAPAHRSDIRSQA